MRMPQVLGVLETALYVDDLARSIEFYQRVLGFQVLSSGSRMASLRIAENQVLLLFKKGASVVATETVFGRIPPTDGDGSLHLAFSISKHEIEEWSSHLRDKGIAIESELSWPAGGSSIYFRDPDSNLLELKSTDWESPIEFE